MDTKTTDLKALNSATKYPSILTYHKLGEKGRLTQDRNIIPDNNLVVTEKVDGTNTRVIFMPDGYFLIGSREHLLFARGDMIGNPAMGIVDSIHDLADTMNNKLTKRKGRILVAFFETYGGKTTAAAKNYTGHQSFGHRLFDVCQINPLTLSLAPTEIAGWRETGGQPYFSEEQLTDFSSVMDVKLTHRITASDLPVTHSDVLSWLEKAIPSTFAALDAEAKNQAEGVVVRTADRQQIAKIRFSDYRRTLR